jgi:hypothetical protein
MHPKSDFWSENKSSVHPVLEAGAETGTGVNVMIATFTTLWQKIGSFSR